MTHSIGPLLRFVALVVVTALPGYFIACRIWPHAACRRCHGQGRFKTSSGKAWRLCPRCSGSGSRIRLGRKIWDRVATRARRTR